MNKRKTVDGDIDNIHHHKRYKIDTTIEETNLLQENNINRRQKRKELMRSKMHNSDQHIQKKICLKNSIDDPNFLFDMVTIPTEYIEHLKESYPERSYLGKPEYQCKYCDAIFWYNERNKKATSHNHRHIVYSNCCKNGKIKLPKFREPPTYLKNLLNPKGDKLCKHFYEK